MGPLWWDPTDVKREGRRTEEERSQSRPPGPVRAVSARQSIRNVVCISLDRNLQRLPPYRTAAAFSLHASRIAMELQSSDTRPCE